MGSYLDKPETTKKSSIEESDLLLVGSSSMQGWRINQEDAHNAILDYGNNSAFFAVYDGHGGAEVAEYCSRKLPDFMKNLESYKSGNYSQALVEAFLGFDATLLDETVLGELKSLSEEYDDDEDEHEEVYNLHKEATMSLSEVLENYHKKNSKGKEKEQSNEVEAPAGSSSSSGSPEKKKTEEKSAELEVSSSSKSSSSREQSDVPSSSSGGGSSSSASTTAPDSTQKIIPESSTQSDSKVDTSNKADATDSMISSSSSAQENGEVAETPSSSSSSSSAVPKTAQPATAAAAGGSGASSNSESAKQSASTVPKSSGGSSSETDSEKAVDSDEEGSDADADEDMMFEDGDEDDEDEEDSEAEDTSDDDEEEEEDDLLNNEFMQKMESGPGKASGCTAVVALLVGREVIVANAGDSRCIICRNGKPVEMSFDHKPEDDIEFERIKKAGGRVSLDGRVNGGLNLSRAIGDHGYKLNKELGPKEQMISAEPDLKKHTLQEGDEFMVLACDGIWNYMSNEEVVLFVKSRIDGGKKTLSEICEELFHNCLAPNTLGDGTGCDNMTAIIVKFKPEIFNLPVTSSPDANETAQNTQAKRTHADDESEQSEAIAAAPQKKLKLDDDLTPAAVDTSTS